MSGNTNDVKQESGPHECGGTRRSSQRPKCARCGYSLRGLESNGRCPECSLAVASSLGARRLACSDASWLGRIRLGYILLAAALITCEVLALMPLISPFMPGSPRGWMDIMPSSLFSAIIALIMLMFVASALLVTIRDPAVAGVRKRPWPTRLIRPTLVSAVLLTLGTRAHGLVCPMLQLTPFVSYAIWHCVTYGLVLVVSVLFLSILLHLAKLADEIPLMKLALQTRRTVGNLMVLLLCIAASVQVSLMAGELWDGYLERLAESATRILACVLIVYFASVVLLVMEHVVAMKEVLRESRNIGRTT